MQVLVKSKTRKMQRHPRQSGHRKTKAIAGSQKEKKVEKKEAKEINQAASLQSSPIELTRTLKAPFPPVKNKGESKQLMLQPRIITLGGSEDSEPSLDYSTPQTSTDLEASQKCTGYNDNLESTSLPSTSCKASDMCACTSVSTGSDSPRLLADLVQLLELKREKISLSDQLSSQREIFIKHQRRCWDLEEELHKYLKVSIKQECEEGMKWRWRIISELETSLRLWVEEEETLVFAAGQVSARIVPYGSFRLGVVDKQSDLDLLAVLPQQISREQFFTSFCALLGRKEEVVRELRVLSTAFVPVVKFKYRGMEVDLTAACLTNFNFIPLDSLLLSQFPTEELDPRCLRR